MCGRYGLNHPHPVLADWYRASSMPEFKPRYNIAPTMDIIAVRETESGRIGSTMRWGLIPYWVKDTKKPGNPSESPTPKTNSRNGPGNPSETYGRRLTLKLATKS